MTLPERRRDLRSARTGWEPFGEFEDVYERMGQLIRDTFGGGLQLPSWSGWSAPIDLEETDDAFVAELDLPGVKKAEVDVELVGSEVRVRGEIKEREHEGMLRRQTRGVGQFDYRFTLPGDVDPEKVEATPADGVLTVRAPKAETTKPRRVDVKVT
jgi:HSP20 family protein